ncbi:MAG: glycosyltransferase family 4 protein [Planctomycetota bacterium]|jgi:glycosyltransferase involved in cell wall biosynthesis
MSDKYSGRAYPRVATISSYVPRRCGLATFCHDLLTAVVRKGYEEPLALDEAVGVFAVNDSGGQRSYGPEVCFEIVQDHGQDYLDAADAINAGPFDLVCLQHEYGIFGGKEGDHILPLLARLRKPVVSILHTVLRDPEPEQRAVLARVCRHSAASVVMSERGRIWLHDLYDVPRERIRVIPHGAPDVPFTETGAAKERLGFGARPTILTFGFLDPSKGVEIVLDALFRLVPDFPDLLYVVLGVTHPAVRRRSGERYREALIARAAALGIEENVHFHNRYVTLEDLREHLLAADVYVTPYTAREQIVSGTLAYALATGRAIVSTPYWYAQELLADGRGLLFDFGDTDVLARHLGALLGDQALRASVRRAAYAFGRHMTWPEVGRRYAKLFLDLWRSRREQTVASDAGDVA